MSDPIVTPAVTSAAIIGKSMLSAETVVTLFGVSLNMMGLAVILIFVGILVLFWRIQRSEKLDFADLITKDGRAVSLTKVLQLIGGLLSSWVIVKLTLTGGLTEAIFGLYLTYVGAIEGYSKFVAAKYNYKETSVKDAAAADAAQAKSE
jgi:hypothetical protein